MRRPITTTTEPALEPSTADLDRVIEHLKTSWTSRVTVRRQSPTDIGIREVYIRLNGADVGMLKAKEELTVDVKPGPHRLTVTNQLFTRSLEFTLAVGEHASFMTINKAGPGTFGVFGFFLGANLIYLSLERETP